MQPKVVMETRTPGRRGEGKLTMQQEPRIADRGDEDEAMRVSCGFGASANPMVVSKSPEGADGSLPVCRHGRRLGPNSTQTRGSASNLT